jgi:DNA-binding NtrC family response regulator
MLLDAIEVLVASSHPEQSQILSRILGNCGLESVVCSSLAEARTVLAEKPIRLAFCEDRLAGADLRDVLQAIAEFRPGIPLIVFSELFSWASYLEVIQQGAFDRIRSPFSPQEIERIVQIALEPETR